MSGQAWLTSALLLGVLATLLVIIQWAWVRLRRNRQIQQAIRTRLTPATEGSGLGGARVDLGPLEKLMVRAGIDWSRRRLVMISSTLLLALFAIAVSRGTAVLMVVLFFVVIAIGVWWRVRFQKQRQIIHEELPVLWTGCYGTWTPAGRWSTLCWSHLTSRRQCSVLWCSDFVMPLKAAVNIPVCSRIFQSFIRFLPWCWWRSPCARPPDLAPRSALCWNRCLPH